MSVTAHNIPADLEKCCPIQSSGRISANQNIQVNFVNSLIIVISFGTTTTRWRFTVYCMNIRIPLNLKKSFRFTLISRMCLGVWKKYETRAYSEYIVGPYTNSMNCKRNRFLTNAFFLVPLVNNI